MTGIVECVPNISEGRDTGIIEAIVDTVRNTPDVTLMNYSSDADHNRSVISFLGNPEAVGNAAVALTGKAAELIDLTRHRGAHPRMGAADVVPFIPLKGVTMEDCVKLAQSVASGIFARFKVPSYLYEYAATAPHRTDLAAVRRGQFEGMAQKTQMPEWIPDFGSAPHPTAGVTAVGARKPLIAFNVNLNTPDVTIADAIARKIRHSSGGMECVKALGMLMKNRDTAQVSINLTDYSRTPLYAVLEAVRTEAGRLGVGIAGTELIGLAPMDALFDCAAHYLQIEDFLRERQVIERFMLP